MGGILKLNVETTPEINVEQMIAALGGLAVVGVVGVIILAIEILLMWLFFKKMGQRGWKCLIPIYNVYILYKCCWNTGKFWKYFVLSIIAGVFSSAIELLPLFGITSPIILLVPAVIALIFMLILVVMQIKLTLRISYSFNHRVLYGLGLLFLPIIFYPILILGKSKYVGPFLY